jgi:hypothetical protein
MPFFKKKNTKVHYDADSRLDILDLMDFCDDITSKGVSPKHVPNKTKSIDITRISDQLETLSYKLDRRRDVPVRPLEKFKTIHFIFVHSQEHASWAEHIKKDLLDSMESLLPLVAFSSDCVLIQREEIEIFSTLGFYYEEYRRKEADQTFVVTPGWWECQAVIMANKAKKVLPYRQLFCLPGNTEELEVENKMEPNDLMLGGVSLQQATAQRYISSIRGVRPDAAAVCIAYDPDPSHKTLKEHITQQVKDLQAACAARGIRTVLHHWSPTHLDVLQLRDVVSTVDSVIILQEPAAEVHRKTLIAICNERKVFICASELDSVLAGAAIGCGIPGGAFGTPLAGLIIEFLLCDPRLPRVNGWTTHKIPMQSGARFNKWAFSLQGIELPEDREALIDMKSADDPSCVEHY